MLGLVLGEDCINTVDLFRGEQSGSSFGDRIGSNLPIFDKQTGSILDRRGSQMGHSWFETHTMKSKVR